MISYITNILITIILLNNTQSIIPIVLYTLDPYLTVLMMTIWMFQQTIPSNLSYVINVNNHWKIYKFYKLYRAMILGRYFPSNVKSYQLTWYLTMNTITFHHIIRSFKYIFNKTFAIVYILFPQLSLLLRNILRTLLIIWIWIILGAKHTLSRVIIYEILTLCNFNNKFMMINILYIIIYHNIHSKLSYLLVVMEVWCFIGSTGILPISFSFLSMGYSFSPYQILWNLFLPIFSCFTMLVWIGHFTQSNYIFIILDHLLTWICRINIPPCRYYLKVPHMYKSIYIAISFLLIIHQYTKRVIIIKILWTIGMIIICQGYWI